MLQQSELLNASAVDDIALVDSLRRELELRCFPEALENLRLSLSRLSDTDIARGAALMMREKLLLES